MRRLWIRTKLKPLLVMHWLLLVKHLPNISQNSDATCLRRGQIFIDDLITTDKTDGEKTAKIRHYLAKVRTRIYTG